MYFKPQCFIKTTTVAARLTTSDIKVSAVTIQAERSNTGYVYIGDDQVSATNYGIDLASADSYSITAQELGLASADISLKDIWFIPSVGADGVSVTYWERVE